ncbi:site-specific integrase [bacterium]|nr:site-specific integrase [bacterium]
MPKIIPEFIPLNQLSRLLDLLVEENQSLGQFQVFGKAYLGLILFYGLGLGEILKIKLQNVNFKKKTLKIEQSSLHDQRILPLFCPVNAWLLEYVRTIPRSNPNRLFQNINSDLKFNHRTLNVFMNKISSLSNIKVTSRILRNTFFLLMFDSRVEHRILQTIMGTHTLATINRRSVISTSCRKSAVESITIL